MFGDIDTVSQDKNDEGQNSSDATLGWSAPTAESLAPSAAWGQDWASPPAAAASPQSWETATPGTDLVPETAAFAGWGALSSADTAAVTQDLSSWDSPMDAEIAEVAATLPAPWVLNASSTSSPWDDNVSAPTAPLEAAPTGWSSPDDTDTDAPITEPADVTILDEGATHHDSVDLVAPAEWEHDAADLHDDRVAPAELGHEARPPMDIWADAPPSPTLPASFLSGTVDDGAPDSSGVPFHEIAAALAASDAVPLASRTEPAPIATQQVEEVAPKPAPTDAEPVKRRGRLAARTARETLAKNAEQEVSEVGVVIPSSLDDGSEPRVEADVEAAPVRAKASGKFFAKKDPSERVDPTFTSPQTPRVVRIAALASLLVGVGLFAFTVINGRSDSTTEIVPTVPAASAPGSTPPSVVSTPSIPAPTLPAATNAPIADPIFGADAPAEVPAESPTPTPTAAAAGDDLAFSDPVDFSK